MSENTDRDKIFLIYDFVEYACRYEFWPLETVKRSFAEGGCCGNKCILCRCGEWTRQTVRIL